MRALDFFIAGVQMARTTVLHDRLAQHPGLFLPARKELHVFDDERIDWSAPDLRPMAAHFAAAPEGALRGEATPIYTYWPNALERIAALMPAAKMIVILRSPVWRAVAHWRMETARGAEDLPFAEAVTTGRARVAAAPGGVHRVYSYVERGFYAPQVRRLLDLFGPEQCLFLRTDDLWTDERACLARICDHLGTGPLLAPAPTRRASPVEGAAASLPEAAAVAALLPLFLDDLTETARLTGLDFGDWMESDYAEPMES